jgi:hypothetical protein
MKQSHKKRNIVLSILFFLPVVFLLMLYPAKHNYVPLDIVNEGVKELQGMTSDSDEALALSDHITIIGFLGYKPLDRAVGVSNLKELIYDKFMGFKKFQVVMVLPKGTEDEVAQLKSEVNKFETLKYWHYVYADEVQIKDLYASLESSTDLDKDLSVQQVFIVDKDLNQRGRIDARDKKELEAQRAAYSLYDYDCIKVAELKNKMSEDLRILFTEYRQKRKGKFDSTTRRASDLNKTNG